MLYRKQSLLFWILSLIVISAQAQITSATLPQIIPASPQATALAKYINYPVDYGTGLVKINIPLYVIKDKDITIPISLSYHSSGLLVNENAGWVGSGWTLNAEPVISRSVKGIPDEKGYLINNYPGLTQQYLIDVANGLYYEEEPDEWYYNLPTTSGGFYFSRQPRTSGTSFQIIKHPYEPVAISYTSPYNIQITDERGLQYQFGTSPSGRLGYERTNTGICTSLKATDIHSNETGENVSFSYTGFQTEYITASTDIIAVEDSIVGGPDNYDLATGCTGCGLPIVTYTTTGSNRYTVSNGQLVYAAQGGQPTVISSSNTVETMKIDTINFRNGKVVFDQDSLQNNLADIKIYNNQRLIKMIRFFQSYYYSNNQYVQRLKLDSIQIGDSIHVNETYRFGYNGNTMPSNLSKSTDMWGYYNGAGNNDTYPAVPVTAVTYLDQSVYPESTIHKTVNIGFANRTPNPTYAQTGILTSIKYPTGGTTQFVYEGNEYLDNGNLTLGGGLRIHQIIDIDPVTNNTLTRQFTYGVSESGAGFVKSLNRPADYMTQQYNAYYKYGAPFGTTRNRIYYSSSLADHFFSGGPPVVYPEVKETQLDANGVENGKTIYKYNYVDPLLGTQPRIAGTNVFIDPKVDWMFGKLIDQESYKTVGSGYVMISKKEYKYNQVYNAASLPAGKVYRLAHIISVPGNEGIDYYNYDPDENILYQAYTINSGALRVGSEITSTISGADTLRTTKVYAYNNTVNLLPSVTTTTSSDGKVITNYEKFPNDTSYADANKELIRQRLIADGNVDAVIEQGYNKGTSTQVLSTGYSIRNGLTAIDTIKSNTGSGGLFEPRINYLLYDNQNNPLSVSKAQGVLINYVWGYGGAYPIAQITGASYNSIQTLLGGATAVQNFRNNLTPSNTDVNNFLAPLRVAGALPIAQLVTYTYDPLTGVTSSTDARGLTSYYEYDNFQRLMNIKDKDGNIIKHIDYHYKGQN